MSNIYKIIIGVTLITTVGLAQAGDVYHWVDEKGVTHYAESAPQGSNATKVKISAGIVQGGNLAEAYEGEDSDADAPEEDADTNENEEQPEASAQESEASKEARETNCQKALANLDVMENNALIRETGEDGKQRILTEDQKQERIQTAQEIRDSYCE
ncbi:MAG: DUF4124 domain-containing protein [Pseudomonadales bacterium]